MVKSATNYSDRYLSLISRKSSHGVFWPETLTNIKVLVYTPQKELAQLQYVHMCTLWNFTGEYCGMPARPYFSFLVKWIVATRKDVPQHFYKLVLCVAESPWWATQSWGDWGIGKAGDLKFGSDRTRVDHDQGAGRRWHRLIFHLWETLIHKLRSCMLQENLTHGILVLKNEYYFPNFLYNGIVALVIDLLWPLGIDLWS